MEQAKQTPQTVKCMWAPMPFFFVPGAVGACPKKYTPIAPKPGNMQPLSPLSVDKTQKTPQKRLGMSTTKVESKAMGSKKTKRQSTQELNAKRRARYAVKVHGRKVAAAQRELLLSAKRINGLRYIPLENWLCDSCSTTGAEMAPTHPVTNPLKDEGERMCGVDGCSTISHWGMFSCTKQCGNQRCFHCFFFTSSRLMGPLAITHGEDFVKKWERKLLALAEEAREQGVNMEQLAKGEKRVASLVAEYVTDEDGWRRCPRAVLTSSSPHHPDHCGRISLQSAPNPNGWGTKVQCICCKVSTFTNRYVCNLCGYARCIPCTDSWKRQAAVGNKEEQA